MRLLDRPRLVSWLCGAIATALGVVYLSLAGAPASYVALNAGALMLGTVIALLLSGSPRPMARGASAAMLALGGALLATALFGAEAEGAKRWLTIGGLVIQPSLLVLPAMVLGFARRPDRLGAAGLSIAAAALALQPDRAMAGALASSLAAIWLIRRERLTAGALVIATMAFAITLMRADQLPAAPYVDQIIYTSFAVHPAVGLALLVGLISMLAPAILFWRSDPANRSGYAAFGAVWLAIIAAAALGNYPTPLVGYGGSAILGYVLGLLALPRRTTAAIERSAPRSESARSGLDRRLRAVAS